MDRDDPDEIIERLKAQAAAAANGRMVVGESDGLSPGLREQFWRPVVEFETAGTTDHADPPYDRDRHLPHC